VAGIWFCAQKGNPDEVVADSTRSDVVGEDERGEEYKGCHRSDTFCRHFLLRHFCRSCLRPSGGSNAVGACHRRTRRTGTRRDRNLRTWEQVLPGRSYRMGAALLEQVIIAKTSLVVNGMGQIGSAGTFI
jgi:hypothetical protein